MLVFGRSVASLYQSIDIRMNMKKKNLNIFMVVAPVMALFLEEVWAKRSGQN